jgi:hypothetical protein
MNGINRPFASSTLKAKARRNCTVGLCRSGIELKRRNNRSENSCDIDIPSISICWVSLVFGGWLSSGLPFRVPSFP